MLISARVNFYTNKSYAGIGSRETPPDILGLMTVLAYHLALDGWILRSGCAPGADTAFEMGAIAALKHDGAGVARPELYLPWPGFEGRDNVYAGRTEPQAEAFEIARSNHPAARHLSMGALKLHARNSHQILGFDVLRPSLVSFVVCWTEGGSGKGGTGQALRLAKEYGVAEIYDLGISANIAKIMPFLRERYEGTMYYHDKHHGEALHR